MSGTTADVIFFLSKPESEMRFIYHEQISVDVSFHRPTTSKEARIQLYSHDSIIIESFHRPTTSKEARIQLYSHDSIIIKWNDHAIHNVCSSQETYVTLLETGANRVGIWRISIR